MLNVIFEDEYFIAVDKPKGILVHRTPLSEDKVFLLQMLRNQVGYSLYTIHRLDRATSGVILLAKKQDIAKVMNEQFRNQQVEKLYLAIVRGWLDDLGTIDYPLKDEETGILKPRNALTSYYCLDRSEIDEAIGLRYPTARFSLTVVIPHTGRRHQIRKHFSHIRHPIIGDKRHGDVKQNGYFKSKYQLERMFLHAISLKFVHPIYNISVTICADLDQDFQRALEICHLEYDTMKIPKISKA